MIVLFSILYQSLHMYEHFVKQFSEKVCHHKYSGKQAEITHQHHKIEHCNVCHFTFGAYVTPEVFVYKLNPNYKQVPHFFKNEKEIAFFSGSLYSHRGPPFFYI
ncbi:hypothetical protein BC624_11212 [Flavobacterium granuli]|uniref:DUF2946 domain-containing protein n=2 Tax=Flavobacterium granuli TaxID=280093 RepID=A0A1M5TD57_9FLAO|nr:hypothetical protein BC624_11212 [Flavobacterium granuli]SHH48649.1 hypothetical protein SAMN05443373_11412 [Flavobacterium granuli]